MVVAILFGVSFVIGLSPEPPDMSDSAVQVATYVSQNQDALRVQVLLGTLAMFAFLCSWAAFALASGAPREAQAVSRASRPGVESGAQRS